MASGSIGPSGLTRESHISPLRQPSPSRSISTKPTSMMMPGAFQANGCLRMNSASGVRLPVVSASKATVSRLETVEEILASTSQRSEAARIPTRFAHRRHGVQPNDSQVSKTALRAGDAIGWCVRPLHQPPILASRTATLDAHGTAGVDVKRSFQNQEGTEWNRGV